MDVLPGGKSRALLVVDPVTDDAAEVDEDSLTILVAVDTQTLDPNAARCVRHVWTRWDTLC